jgi:hypothetical protein
MNCVMPVDISHSISLLSQHIEPSNLHLSSRDIFFLFFGGNVRWLTLFTFSIQGPRLGKIHGKWYNQIGPIGIEIF